MDLSIWAARRTSVERYLTSKLKDRLRADMADPDKRKQRDSSNSLLSANLNKVVNEECRTNSRLGEVGLCTLHCYAPLFCICSYTCTCRWWWRARRRLPRSGTGRGA